MDTVVEIKDVSFAYGGEAALERVNLSIGAREFVCVVGPNGGGKSTLLKLIMGLLKPHTGTVRVFGQPPERSLNRVGYVSQQLMADMAFPISVMDVVLMGRLGRGTHLGPFGAFAGELRRDKNDVRVFVPRRAHKQGEPRRGRLLASGFHSHLLEAVVVSEVAESRMIYEKRIPGERFQERGDFSAGCGQGGVERGCVLLVIAFMRGIEAYEFAGHGRGHSAGIARAGPHVRVDFAGNLIVIARVDFAG